MNQIAADAAQIGAGCEADVRPKAKTRTRLKTLGHLDRRTMAARRAAALAETFAAELGGQLSDVQRVAVQNAAVMVAISEDAQTRRLAGEPGITLDDIVRATSAARRAVKDLGIKAGKPAPAVSLAEHLAARAAELAGERSEGPA